MHAWLFLSGARMGFQSGYGSKKMSVGSVSIWKAGSVKDDDVVYEYEYGDFDSEVDGMEDIECESYDPFQPAIESIKGSKARGAQGRQAIVSLELPGLLAKDWRLAESPSWSQADPDDIEHCLDRLAAKGDDKNFALLAKNASANGKVPSSKALSRRAWRCVVSGSFESAMLWTRVEGFDPNTPAQAGARLLQSAIAIPDADRAALAFCQKLCAMGALVDAGGKNALADAVLSSNYECARAIAEAYPESAASVPQREDLFKCAASAARFDLALSLRGGRLEWVGSGESPLMGLLRSMGDGSAKTKQAEACAKIVAEELACADDAGIAACGEQLNVARGFCEARGWIAIGREVGRAWEILRERVELLGASLGAVAEAKSSRMGRSL
jgi:hypothetical protein